MGAPIRTRRPRRPFHVKHLEQYLTLPEQARTEFRHTLTPRETLLLDQAITQTWHQLQQPNNTSPAAAYTRRPLEFTERFIPTLTLTDYQQTSINDLVNPDGHGRASVKGPRGLGKTLIAAVTIFWFAITHEAARSDWKAVITSGSWFQITAFLFPEIRKICRLADWDALQIPPWREEKELLRTGINLTYGAATSSSPDRPELIEGAHAAAGTNLDGTQTTGSVLVVFDESKAIPESTFDAIEGVFSNIDQQTTFGYALAVSTPGPPSGKFYQIHRRAPGTEVWVARTVTLQQAIDAGRVTQAWADNLARLWGTDSAHYRNHVLGEFAAADEAAVIPTSWVEAAIGRWEQRRADQWTPPDEYDIGLDVAREGKDKTIATIGRGPDHVERFIRINRTDDFTDTATELGQYLTPYGRPPARIAVDADGMGAGLGDILRHQGHTVYYFRGGPKADKWRDQSGELEAFNRRSAAWWNMRELLDPALDATLALPPDDEMIGDLTAPKLVHDPQGRIKIESKEQTKKRIGRSPDVGDSCVYRHWREPPKRTRVRFIE